MASSSGRRAPRGGAGGQERSGAARPTPARLPDVADDDPLPGRDRLRELLDRAAWQLRGGSSVTAAAFAAGYESVEGFARAFARAYGRSPGTPDDGRPRTRDEHWLPAPNGIHFHPPTSLWVADEGRRGAPDEVTALLVHHDVEDTRT